MNKKVLASFILASMSFCSSAEISTTDIDHQPTAGLQGQEEVARELCGVNIKSNGNGNAALFNSGTGELDYASNNGLPVITLINNKKDSNTTIEYESSFAGGAVESSNMNKVLVGGYNVSEGAEFNAEGNQSGTFLSGTQEETHKQDYKLAINLVNVQDTLKEGDIRASITLTINCS